MQRESIYIIGDTVWTENFNNSKNQKSHMYKNRLCVKSTTPFASQTAPGPTLWPADQEILQTMYKWKARGMTTEASLEAIMQLRVLTLKS
jgi:hypothetical protein